MKKHHALRAATVSAAIRRSRREARFLLPTRYGDDVEIETAFTKVGRSSFAIQHRLTLDGALAVEGNETRVWVVRDPTRPGGFRPQPMPDDDGRAASALLRLDAELLRDRGELRALLLHRCRELRARCRG